MTESISDQKLAQPSTRFSNKCGRASKGPELGSRQPDDLDKLFDFKYYITVSRQVSRAVLAFTNAKSRRISTA